MIENTENPYGVKIFCKSKIPIIDFQLYLAWLKHTFCMQSQCGIKAIQSGHRIMTLTLSGHG